MNEKVVKRIAFLENFLLKCKKAYYENDGAAIVDGQEISDVEYDAAEDELLIMLFLILLGT